MTKGLQKHHTLQAQFKLAFCLTNLCIKKKNFIWKGVNESYTLQIKKKRESFAVCVSGLTLWRGKEESLTKTWPGSRTAAGQVSPFSQQGLDMNGRASINDRSKNYISKKKCWNHIYSRASSSQKHWSQSRQRWEMAPVTIDWDAQVENRAGEM